MQTVKKGVYTPGPQYGSTACHYSKKKIDKDRLVGVGTLKSFFEMIRLSNYYFFFIFIFCQGDSDATFF